MNKLLLVLSFTVLSLPILAAQNTFTCTARQDAKDDGFETLTLTVSPGLVAYQANQVQGSALRDPSFEQKHPNDASIMFTENSKTSPFVSDIGTKIFVDKTLFYGKSGSIGVATGQPNDGDSGPMYLWYTVHFDCVSK